MREENMSEPKGIVRSDCEKILELAESLVRHDAAKALTMCNEALQFAEETRDITLQAEALRILGKTLQKTLRNNDAIDAYSRALELYTEINDEQNIGILSMHIGAVYLATAHYSEALPFFEKAYTVFSQKNDMMRAAHQLSMIAECHLKMTNLDMALRCFLEVLEIQEGIDDKQGLTNTLNGIGNVYFTLKDFDRSLQYHTQAFALKKEILPVGHFSIFGSIANLSVLHFIRQEYDIALRFQLQLCDHYSHNKFEIEYARVLSNLGRTYQRLGRIDEALEAEYEALEICRLIDNKGLETTILINIARIYVEQDKPEECLELLKQAEEIALEIHAKDWELECLYLKWCAYEKLGDYKNAFYTFRQHAKLESELMGREKEKEIEQLRLRHELHKALAEKVQIQQKLTVAEHKSLRAQINPHFFFNSLSSIQNFLAQNDKESANKYLTKFAKLMRMILDNSRFSTISLADEIEYLQLYVDMEKMRLNNSFEFIVHTDTDINTDTVEVPTMIFQPFLENAIWHGIVPEQSNPLIEMYFSKNDTMLHCEIVDNGRGIYAGKADKKEHVHKHRSAGVDIIRERLELLSKSTGQTLTLSIEDRTKNNEPEKGTRVIINLPLNLDIEDKQM